MKTITICSSVAFYKHVVEVEQKLVKLRYKVLTPKLARTMHKTGNYEVSSHKTWYKDPSTYKKKQQFMDAHFKKVAKGDAVLIVNNEKNGMSGYIGGNVLMEITVAYYLKKPIFILNPIDEDLPIKEEIYGIFPTFLDGDVKKIGEYL